MNPLLAFNDRHPLATGLAGSLGSIAGALGAWYLDHLTTITAIAANISAVGGFLIFVFTIAVKLVAAARERARRWRQRRLHELDSLDIFAEPPQPPPQRIIVEAHADGTWTIQEPVHWIDLATGARIEVPAGERTDFASVPRILWPIIPPFGKHSLAAVVHDHLYKVRGHLPERDLPRRACDRIFREVMAYSGVRVTRRWVMWLGVRLGGWVPWHFGPRDDDDDFQTPGNGLALALA